MKLTQATNYSRCVSTCSALLVLCQTSLALTGTSRVESGKSWEELGAPNAQNDDCSSFGAAVASAGHYIVIGAPDENTYTCAEQAELGSMPNAPRAGACYLFRTADESANKTLEFVQRLAVNGKPNQRLGVVVAISSDGTVAATDSDRRSIYVFDRKAAPTVLGVDEPVAGFHSIEEIAVNGSVVACLSMRTEPTSGVTSPAEHEKFYQITTWTRIAGEWKVSLAIAFPFADEACVPSIALGRDSIFVARQPRMAENKAQILVDEFNPYELSCAAPCAKSSARIAGYSVDTSSGSKWMGIGQDERHVLLACTGQYLHSTDLNERRDVVLSLNLASGETQLLLDRGIVVNGPAKWRIVANGRHLFGIGRQVSLGQGDVRVRFGGEAEFRDGRWISAEFSVDRSEWDVNRISNFAITEAGTKIVSTYRGADCRGGNSYRVYLSEL